MIDVALTFLVAELNDCLRASYSPTEAKAVWSAHCSPDASPVAEILNKVSVTLVNLEPDSTLRKVLADWMSTGDELLRRNPAIQLNLLVLFAAHFSDYPESLNVLTAVLTFFEDRNVFTPQNSPRLALAFERLTLELVPTSQQDVRFLWGTLGPRYAPGAVYRLRMSTLQKSKVQESTPAIQAMAVNR
jgi:hypothetical protein